MSSRTKNVQLDKIIFLGRTEQLDWKKIASIDIDNLIHNGDTSQLLELIKPVTFCKADTEFDDGKIRVDPAFIKVFRISQLISEFLLASQEKSMERLADLQEKHNETEKEKEKLSEEILHLKETLTSAKKELKKRKEMLATTQNEMLGENNGDEYDQCPYCSKKFLGPGFLLAHIQRRHQGLPVNPLYPSFPSGSTSVVYHHSHPQTPQASHHRQHSHQQTPGSGIYDPHNNISFPQPSQHVQTLLNQQHQLFPAGPTPSPSMLYSNNQLLPSNLSFSGSVTSLNNIPFNHNQVPSAASVHGKRESFTQTSILTNAEKHPAEFKKSSSQLALLPEEMPTAQRQQADEPFHSSDKHSPDSLNQLPSSLHRDSPLQMETLQRPQLPPSPIHTQSVDGSHPTTTTTTDGDGDAGMENTSTMLRNWERVEATKMDVFRVQNQREAHWSNMEEEKVRQNGTDEVTNAMISETLQGTTRFSINSSQNHLREDGEVTKSSADVINHSQNVEERGKEFAELKNLLQASVQGELKSLISRLESQEQFWQDKLASLQQDHEMQIQQLRHEVQIQNGTKRNNDNGPARDENGVVMVNDNVLREREIGDDEKENGKIITQSYSGKEPPPNEIILVEPKDGHYHHTPQSLHENLHQRVGTSYVGAPRDALDDQNDDEDGGESISSKAPVAKPRKSKAVAVTEAEGKHHQQYHHQQQQREEMSRLGTLAQLQSLSESDPELLAIIQPEEFHGGKHDNSILPNSNDVSGGTSTTATTARVATATTNNARSKQQNQQHPLSSSRTLPATNSDSRGAEEEIAPTLPASEVKSDEVSDYTLSDSVELEDDEEQNNDIRAVSSHKKDKQHERQLQHHHHDHPDFSNHPRGKYSVKQMPVKKKYVFDAEARKIVEVSPDDDDDAQDGEGDEYSENNTSDLNSSSCDDELTEGKKRTSQLDLVRAKTIIELEQNMSDIGLNPESTAIGMEEMKRALKHFKSQQRATTSNDQIDDYEKLEEERNVVKTLAKFEAVKSSIDEKLDAISTLSSKKSQQSSFVKMLTAVKSSGKSFGKRVASAVKKKHKSEHGSDDDKKGGNEKRKRKPSSAPVMKTTFFSKARWTRRKKGEAASGKKGALVLEEDEGKKTGKEETENASDMSSSEESDEEIELPPFMQHTNTNNNDHQRHRRGSSSRSSERRGSSSGPSRRNSARSGTHRKRSSSRPKSAKPLKRLSSNASATNKSTPTHQPKSSAAVTSVGINSSESSPFSNVDEYDCGQSTNTGSSTSNESNNTVGDNEREEHFGNHPKSKTQKRKERCKESVRGSVNQRRQQENISNDDDDDDHDHNMDDELKRKEIIGVGTTGESQSEDWDDGDDEVSFATSNEILAKAKSSGVISVESYGKSNSGSRKDKRWKNEMSDTRLQEIKQYVSKSKKEVTGDGTSFSEEDSEEESLNRKEKAVEQKQSGESKQDCHRERKLAFVENTSGKLPHAKIQPDGNSERRQRWAATIQMEDGIKQSQQQLQPRELTVPSRYISPGQINSNTQSGSKPTPVLSELSTRKRFQFAINDDDSEWSNDDRRANVNEISPTSIRNGASRQSRFLTSTPKRASPAMRPGQRETTSQQMQNSFDDMNDLDDLLNTTLSDDDPTEEKQQQQQQQLKNRSPENGNRNPQIASEPTTFKRKPLVSGMVMQPTNHHHHLSRGLGTTNLRSKAETQSNLFDVGKGRSSSASRNSWDSQK